MKIKQSRKTFILFLSLIVLSAICTVYLFTARELGFNNSEAATLLSGLLEEEKLFEVSFIEYIFDFVRSVFFV